MMFVLRHIIISTKIKNVLTNSAGGRGLPALIYQHRGTYNDGKQDRLHNKENCLVLMQVKSISLNNIEVFEEQIQKDLKVLKNYSKALVKSSDAEDHISLTVSFGIETYEAYLKWCAKAKKILKQSGGK
ncbi:MAG: hypothetical protein K6B69_08235 [Lachnospiraceae bacterium]|nr:hypothetical protein [Lachnospiraceae bacterium]